MTEFSKKQIETLNHTDDDLKVCKQWVEEVESRIQLACKNIEEIFLLREPFNLETQSISVAAIAETKALTEVLSNALALHAETQLGKLLQEAYQRQMTLVDKAVQEYQTIKKWFTN